MRFGAYLKFALILLFLAGMAAEPIMATPVVQDQSDSTEAQAETGSEPSDESQEGISDARRLIRIERAIKADKERLERLAKLKTDLEERESQFELMAVEREELKSARAEKTNRLEELKAAGELERVASVEGELANLDQQFQLLTNQTELTYDSAKSLQEQIRALEEKIAKDEKARDQLMGVQRAAEAPAPGPTTEVGVQPSTTAPMPQVVPGLPAPSTTPSAEPPAPVAESAVQIEARREAERREAEAQEAEQAVMDFLERKAALEEQIDLLARQSGPGTPRSWGGTGCGHCIRGGSAGAGRNPAADTRDQRAHAADPPGDRRPRCTARRSARATGHTPRGADRRHPGGRGAARGGRGRPQAE
jgi:hypothetical protein